MPTRTAPRRLSKIKTHFCEPTIHRIPCRGLCCLTHTNVFPSCFVLRWGSARPLRVGRSSLCSPGTADFLEEALLDLDLVPRTDQCETAWRSEAEATQLTSAPEQLQQQPSDSRRLAKHLQHSLPMARRRERENSCDHARFLSPSDSATREQKICLFLRARVGLKEPVPETESNKRKKLTPHTLRVQLPA